MRRLELHHVFFSLLALCFMSPAQQPKQQAPQLGSSTLPDILKAPAASAIQVQVVVDHVLVMANMVPGQPYFYFLRGKDGPGGVIQCMRTYVRMAFGNGDYHMACSKAPEGFDAAIRQIVSSTIIDGKPNHEPPTTSNVIWGKVDYYLLDGANYKCVPNQAVVKLVCMSAISTR